MVRPQDRADLSVWDGFVRKTGGHERTCPDGRFDVAFVLELFECGRNRAACESVLFREASRGWHAGSGFQAAIQNGSAEFAVKPAAQFLAFRGRYE